MEVKEVEWILEPLSFESTGAGGVGEYDRAWGVGGVVVVMEGKVWGRNRYLVPTGEGSGAGSGNVWAIKGVAFS